MGELYDAAAEADGRGREREGGRGGRKMMMASGREGGEEGLTFCCGVATVLLFLSRGGSEFVGESLPSDDDDDEG